MFTVATSEREKSDEKLQDYPLEHRNLDLTNLICNAASRRKKKTKFHLVLNYKFESCHFQSSQVSTVKTEVAFSILP